jgi:hypothetical protein
MSTPANTEAAGPPDPSATRSMSNLLGSSRVARVGQTAGKLVIAIDPAVLCTAFGVADPQVATRLLSQLISVLQPDAEKADAEAVNHALALIAAIGPKDVLEAMTATMLVAAQHAALDTARRAMHPAQTATGRALYGALSHKSMRAYARLLDALNQGRGKGVTQQIIVKRVTVESGAQAIVGSVRSSEGRGDAN